MKTSAAWVGGQGVNRFESVLVCVNEADDIDMLSDFLVRYQSCPVVCFVNLGEEEFELEDEFKSSKVFAKGTDKKDMASHIQAEVDKVKGEVNKIFAEFDKDNSGSIDQAELKAVVA